MSVPLYLKILAIVFAAAIGLPLLLFPLKWGRFMRWGVPDDTHLTVYFGRCLGAVALAIAAMYYRYAEEAKLHGFMLEMLVGAFSLMVVIHVWGFIRKTQPWTEHLEIPLYAGLAAYSMILRNSLI